MASMQTTPNVSASKNEGKQKMCALRYRSHLSRTCQHARELEPVDVRARRILKAPGHVARTVADKREAKTKSTLPKPHTGLDEDARPLGLDDVANVQQLEFVGRNGEWTLEAIALVCDTVGNVLYPSRS